MISLGYEVNRYKLLVFVLAVALAGLIVTLQNELADKVGPLVTLIMGVIFVVCVLAFRRDIFGEGIALYWRMIGERGN